MLNDPLVPLDFGGWFRRVFSVFGHNFRRLGSLALIPAVLYAVGLIAMVAVVPGAEQIQQRLEDADRAAGGNLSSMAATWVIFGRLVPVALAVTIVMLVVGAFFIATSFYLVTREANGQPTTSAQALGFARPRVLPLIGWSVLAGVVMAVVLGVALVPGVLSGVGWLAGVGGVIGAALMLAVSVVFTASVVGVVVVERGGVKRAGGLIRGWFWASCGRLVVAGLIYIVYGALMKLATFPLDGLSGQDGSVTAGVVFGALVQGILLIPAMVFIVAVCLVSYAELRYREDRATSTGTLAAQLAA